jgi:hypothetical protein
MGIAAKLEAEVDDDSSSSPFSLPDSIEVALFVAPGPMEFLVVKNVILLNAWLSLIENFGSNGATKLLL